MGIFKLSLIIFYVSFMLFSSHALASKKSYVVYLGAHSHGPSVTSADYKKVTDSHYDFLASYVGGKDKAKNAIFYSYTKHINGFSAYLEEEEAAAISKHPSVVSVFLNKLLDLHTTRSWEFLGLEKNGIVPKGSLMRRANFGKDVIISHLDSGVWPESKSFNDGGMGPIPSKWQGKCVTDTPNPVKCNRKLIGARMYYKGREAHHWIDPSQKSPRDFEGHGTHTLSTAAGRLVQPESLYGQANGTAMGGSSLARVATYKVCWNGDCASSDILAGFDDAIEDGVDVISVSLGGDPVDYYNDPIAIGSFHAISKGIFVACSAGNDGSFTYTVSNAAPWLITVAASTIDRTFHSDVSLGNGKRYKGRSIAQHSLPKKKLYPLIYAADAKAPNATHDDARLCHPGSLDPTKVKGKIVFCDYFPSPGEYDNVKKSKVVGKAKGAGMIIADDTPSVQEVYLNYELYYLPATNIGFDDGDALLSYIKSTKSPKAYIHPVTTNLDNKPAPRMADFSSMGPSMVTPNILKPDITAPGVNILASFSLAASPTTTKSDSRRVPYSILSGTSMSCPHVAGIAGLLKSLHHDWSPAAIRSAIMTTAGTRDDMNEPIKDDSLAEATPINYGSGHVRPNHAMDPGLVYDLTLEDYLNFLCSYSPKKMALFYNKTYDCPSKNVSHHNLNYPSISVAPLNQSTTVIRRVKNVGAPGIYKVRYSAPQGVIMKVEPKILNFKKMGEEKVFVVTLAPKKVLPVGLIVFGEIVWSDGVHHVRSPVMAIG